MPEPCLARPPVPEITPAKVVEVLSAPVARVAEPRVTAAAVLAEASEPMVSALPARSKTGVPVAARVTRAPSEIWLAAARRSVAEPEPSPTVTAPGSAVTPALLLRTTVPASITVPPL